MLADVSHIVATTLNTNALLQDVAESIRHHFGYRTVGLFTLDNAGQTLALRGYSSTSSGPPKLPTPEVCRQPIGQDAFINPAVHCGTQRRLCDATSEDSYLSANQSAAHTEVCVPILDIGRLIGVIEVEGDPQVDFDPGALSLLETIADIVSIGLRSVRLHEKSQRRSQELALLSRVSGGFGAGLNLDTLIDSTLDGLHELVNADRTYFITVDPDNRTWQRTHIHVAPGYELGSEEAGTFDDMPVELERLMTGKPFAVFDTTFDLRIDKTREMYQSHGTQSVLLVPVQFGKRLHGAIGCDYCREKHAWSPEEIRLLEGTAHQLELALDNLHLFEEVRLRADELATTLARLEELDRLKDEFIQNVSHELRSPLAIIQGYVEMLESGGLGELRPEQQKPVSIIARRVRMLGDLVKDVTLILEAEVSPPEPESVALGELIHTAVEDFQLAVQQAELTLRVEITPELPPVSISYTYMRRVLDNLLGNAIKFTPTGGTITVQAKEKGNQIVLKVSDTGRGIPSDQLERIFERFYQVDGSIWRRYGGMGLGLALVKEIVEAYGGQVTVESRLGLGSTFSILLPIATDTSLGDEPH